MSNDDDLMQTFTPLSHKLLAEGVNLFDCAIFGEVWRLERLPKGCCFASASTIAQTLKLSRERVQRGLKRLRELGLIEDHSLGLRNKPHIRTTAGKVSVAQKAARIYKAVTGNAKLVPIVRAVAAEIAEQEGFDIQTWEQAVRAWVDVGNDASDIDGIARVYRLALCIWSDDSCDQKSQESSRDCYRGDVGVTENHSGVTENRSGVTENHSDSCDCRSHENILEDKEKRQGEKTKLAQAAQSAACAAPSAQPQPPNERKRLALKPEDLPADTRELLKALGGQDLLISKVLGKHPESLIRALAYEAVARGEEHPFGWMMYRLTVGAAAEALSAGNGRGE